MAVIDVGRIGVASDSAPAVGSSSSGPTSETTGAHGVRPDESERGDRPVR